MLKLKWLASVLGRQKGFKRNIMAEAKPEAREFKCQISTELDDEFEIMKN
jgi:hypothetical protein